ncbi:hypothetical protein L3X38_041128 [Prunus dulcis]|uniref:ABC-2 type transporter family protein n=1 Tax=Prunus dulcis TaxID=3755 RepID=A0AAD4US23_PRUDU|nr:hypothetical protein L3X38_041128 [Prunus dulcis]
MDVINELGLERCQDTLIGGTFVRGVSGGERKRVCIGNEILLNPSLLFLDEPTSGLDSTAALRTLQMLHIIAKAGKTVVTTIHQPSSRIFNKFDKLILLGGGSSLYFGKASEAMMYFSSIGCAPLIAMNPAEFLIDLAKRQSNQTWNNGEGKAPNSVLTVGESKMAEDVIFKGIKSNLDFYGGNLMLHPQGEFKIRLDCCSSFQYFGLSFLCLLQFFTFPQERAIVAKERSVEMYKLSAYFLARNISDLPLDLLLPIVFLVIVYLMAGLKLRFSAFFQTMLTIFLSIVASQGLGLSIGAAFIDVKKATTLASIIVMTFCYLVDSLSGKFHQWCDGSGSYDGDDHWVPHLLAYLLLRTMKFKTMM